MLRARAWERTLLAAVALGQVLGFLQIRRIVAIEV